MVRESMWSVDGMSASGVEMLLALVSVWYCYEETHSHFVWEPLPGSEKCPRNSSGGGLRCRRLRCCYRLPSIAR